MSTLDRQHPLYISPTPTYHHKEYNDYELDSDAGAHYATPSTTANYSSAADSLLSNQDTVERGQARSSSTHPSQAPLASAHSYQDIDRTRPTPRALFHDIPVEDVNLHGTQQPVSHAQMQQAPAELVPHVGRSRASSLRRDDAPRASPTPSSQPRSEAPVPTPPPSLGRPEQNNRGSATGQQGPYSSQRVPSHIPAPAAANGKADPRMYGLAPNPQHQQRQQQHQHQHQHQHQQQQQQQQQRNCLVELAHGGDMRSLERLALDVARLARHGDSEAVIDLLTTPAESSSISSLSSYLSALSTTDGTDKEKQREMNFAGHVTTVRPLGQQGSGYSVEHIHSGLTDSTPDQAHMDAKLLVSLTQPLLEASGIRSPASGPLGSFTSELSQTECRIMIDALLAVCHHAKKITVKESRLLELQSPCYVLGDIHGNLTDLEFFRQRVWPNDPQATGGEFLFLGDFVDRGLDSIPVVAYIMAMKVLNPNKWWMIRGNHETREVNGNVEHYQQGSFLAQCLSAFGDHDGHIVWEAVNTFFDTLPLAATIDGSIFCVHGGIPRELCVPDASMDLIRKIECPLRSAQASQMVYDMLWSDPSTPEQEASAGELDQIGFGLSPRGCACFGERSVDNFLAKYGFQHVFRGHEAQKSGVGVSKSARLTTIFSTSRDHFPADVPATCGCVLVEHGEIHPIVRSMPAIPASSFLAQTFVQQSVEATDMYALNESQRGGHFVSPSQPSPSSLAGSNQHLYGSAKQWMYPGMVQNQADAKGQGQGQGQGQNQWQGQSMYSSLRSNTAQSQYSTWTY